MDWDTWKAMPEHEKAKHRDLRLLTPQLVGLEGWRVEVEDVGGVKRRFIVGRSTGWWPCHLEIARRNSSGGTAAPPSYANVRRLYKVR